MRKRLQVAEERVSELEDFETSLRSQLEDSRSTQADIEYRLRNSEVMLLEAERNTKRTQSRFREMEAEKDRIKVRQKIYEPVNISKVQLICTEIRIASRATTSNARTVDGRSNNFVFAYRTWRTRGRNWRRKS